MSDERNNIEQAYEGVQTAMIHLQSLAKKYGLGRHSAGHILEAASRLKFPEHRDFEAEAAAREILPVVALQQALDVFIAWYVIDKGAQGALDASIVLEMAAEHMGHQGDWND